MLSFCCLWICQQLQAVFQIFREWIKFKPVTLIPPLPYHDLVRKTGIGDHPLLFVNFLIPRKKQEKRKMISIAY